MDWLDATKWIDSSEFAAFLERFDALMLTDVGAALRHVDAAPSAIRDEDEWVICRAQALRCAAGVKQAAEYLVGVLAEEPGFADAHHELASCFAELGNPHEAVKHQLEVLRLDVALDVVAEPASAELLASVAAEAGRVMATLPKPWKEKLNGVPLLLVSRPSVQQVTAGVDSRALGLFEGPGSAGAEFGELGFEPSAMSLFANCLLDAFGDDEGELLEQVRVTILHEAGHCFGLDEEQLVEIGLE